MSNSQFFKESKINERLFLVRIIWFAILMSGGVITFVLPPLESAEQIKMVFLGVCATTATLSFVIPMVFANSFHARKLTFGTPEFAAAFLGLFFVSRVVAFALTESVAILGNFALGSEPNGKLYVLTAFILLMAAHFPTMGKAESLLQKARGRG